jgi:multiple sugar transport system substrate-binding protein
MDYYVNNADLAAFTALLPDARFAPIIPGWEEVAQITSDAMQKIYLGSAEPEAALKDAAAKANAVLKK